MASRRRAAPRPLLVASMDETVVFRPLMRGPACQRRVKTEHLAPVENCAVRRS
jgi:hypothetical protein